MTNEDTLRALGKLAPENAERDAVHIAVAPVIAGMALVPGDKVLLRDEKAFYCKSKDSIGIADPFFPSGEVIPKGKRFWLFLNPGSITYLSAWLYGKDGS